MRILPLCLLLVLPGAALANGNVTTERTDDGLIIRGDSGDNEFDVTYGTDAQENDVLVITGKNGTTVNGETTFEAALPDGKSKLTELDVESAGGTDTVTIDLTGLPPDKRFREVDVDGARGTTTVKNVDMNGGKLRVQSFGGDTTVENCDAGDLNVKAEGTGNVTVRNCNAGKLKIFNSGANTMLTVEDCFYQQTDIRSNGKAEVQPSLDARIRRTAGKKVSFQGGGANDSVAFEDNELDAVSVKLGGGADLVSFAGSTIHKLSIDGGPGALDCFDESVDGNVFGAFKQKGFEEGACAGLELVFGPSGQDPFVEPPPDAVAWRVSDGGHADGPFALPGADNPLGLPVLDPADVPEPAHWFTGPECVAGKVELPHLHDAFEGHADPNPTGCGHGTLAWGFLVPVL